MRQQSRTEQLDDLLIGLGFLLAPICELLRESSLPLSIIPFVRAQFNTDSDLFINKVLTFCRYETYDFSTEYHKVRRSVKSFIEILEPLEKALEKPEARIQAMEAFQKKLLESRQSLRMIPVNDPDVILPANSPFQTYIKLRAICTTAKMRVQLFDPYIDATVFHCYLANTEKEVEVTLVSHEKSVILPSSASSKIRRDQIVAVSELFALERPDTYKFLVTADLHDRHLRVDDTIYHLGGSIKDASVKTPYTISNLDPTKSNHDSLNDLITKASEWYGPSTRKHRRE